MTVLSSTTNYMDDRLVASQPLIYEPNLYLFLFAIMHGMMVVAEEKDAEKYHEQCTVFSTNTPSSVISMGNT